MQHEPLRQPLLAENAGDVLASIRRLIAQDDTGRPLPGRPFGDHPFHRAPRPGAQDMPLVLGQSDLVAGDAPRPAPAVPPAVEWQPAIIAELPHARILGGGAAPAEAGPAPQAAGPVTAPPAAAVAVPAGGEPGWSDLSPEEQAEFAEAEAVLARMTAGVRPPGLSPAQTAEIVEFPLAEPVQDAAPAPAPEPEAAATAAPNLFAPADDGEQDLRRQVRALIRHELEGAMGERFSANLRQLIRAEVETVIRGLCAQG